MNSVRYKLTGTWNGHYDNNVENTFHFNLVNNSTYDIEGIDTDERTIFTRLKTDGYTYTSEIEFYVVPKRNEPDNQPGFKIFKGYISSQAVDKIQGIYDTDQDDSGEFTMTKQLHELTVVNLSNILTGIWTGGLPRDVTRMLRLNLNFANASNGTIGEGQCFGKQVWILVGKVNFEQKEITLCCNYEGEEINLSNVRTTLRMVILSDDTADVTFVHESNGGNILLRRSEQ